MSASPGTEERWPLMINAEPLMTASELMAGFIRIYDEKFLKNGIFCLIKVVLLVFLTLSIMCQVNGMAGIT